MPGLSRNLLRGVQRLWSFTEAATFFSRVAPGNAFSPTGGYGLYRVLRDETRKVDDEVAMGRASLTLAISQADLDNAGAPDPKVSDKLSTPSDGIAWDVLTVSREDFGETWILGVVAERAQVT